MTHINPADNLILGLRGPVGRESSKAPEKAVAAGVDSLDHTFDRHIQKALSITESSEQVDIAQIRKELEAGVYDSPEMARAAAEKMLRLGL